MNAGKWFCAVLMFALCCGGMSVAQTPRHPEYRPLFDAAVLEKADRETRERLQALDEKNYQAWLKRRPADTDPSEPAQAGDAGSVMYRYVDAEGRVQYTDSARAGAERVEIATRAPSAEDVEAYQESLRAQDQVLEDFAYEAARKRAADEQHQAAARKRSEHAVHCESLFHDLQDYRRGGAVYYELDEQGMRRYYSDAELEQKIQTLEARYVGECGPLPDYDL